MTNHERKVMLGLEFSQARAKAYERAYYAKQNNDLETEKSAILQAQLLDRAAKKYPSLLNFLRGS